MPKPSPGPFTIQVFDHGCLIVGPDIRNCTLPHWQAEKIVAALNEAYDPEGLRALGRPAGNSRDVHCRLIVKR